MDYTSNYNNTNTQSTLTSHTDENLSEVLELENKLVSSNIPTE